MEKDFLNKFFNDKNYWKVRDHCHFTGKCRDAAHSICNLRFNVPNEIPVVFYNGSNYNYHFIIKELANEFEGQFECLGENTEKYKTFIIPIEKKITKIDKDGNESVFTISYKVTFIDNARFILLIVSGKKLIKFNIKIVIFFLKYESVKCNSIKYKCLSCNKNYINKVDE